MRLDVSMRVLGLMLMALCVQAVGCGPMPGEKQMVNVQAEYLGLANQRIAVMVAADSHMLYQYAEARDNVCRAITAGIAKNVPGVTITIPDLLSDFQDDNPYWINMRYGELAKRLDVDMIVLVDLIEYQTHEPGNAHLWQGLITGNIGVIDAHSPDPDNFVFQNTVTVQFPEDSTVGVIDSDDDTIQLGMVTLFARRGGGLFYDHQIEIDK